MALSHEVTVAQRRPELDAIRLFVVLGLVFFHAALVFDTRDDYYVKNPHTTEAVTYLAGLGVVWAMPALFLIAGLGTWHSTRRRGVRGFLGERLLRLGVPLVFATLTIIPVPQWLQLKAADPAYDDSYPRFLLHFFDVHLSVSDFPFIVQGDLFETGHLWFVVLLLAFSVMLAPLVAWLPGERAARVRDAAARAVRRRGVLLVLPAVPLAVVGALLGMEEDYAGWSRWAYLLFFLYGFVLAADDRFRAAMRRDAKVAAVIGVLLFGAAGIGLGTAGGDPFTDMTAHAVLTRAIFGAAGWFWLVAILGLLDRPSGESASRGNGGYLAAAALPIYILHQPILVTVAYFVVRWHLPMLVGYLTIVVFSFVIIFAVYDLCVRRTRVTRFLFGMRRP
ncbi:acyltransferase family protein [Actinoplanes sp. TBRC 11911]|uniref:acyltransferase family protein n=1 Tax=Actinoplanes sp. TBRC 11911 TaxID=2729386 RepID=UPI00145EE7B9|nr:acyltransferase family protein [Actinoplanes sp. TBRC 11911]NMO53900.1 acyltransferase family protein [Actinoplanes sp. TBRC 11911]